jgi:hypothetical protein
VRGRLGGLGGRLRLLGGKRRGAAERDGDESEET